MVHIEFIDSKSLITCSKIMINAYGMKRCIRVSIIFKHTIISRVTLIYFHKLFNVSAADGNSFFSGIIFFVESLLSGKFIF